MRTTVAAVVVAAGLIASAASAQETRSAAVGPQYAAGGAQRLWLGDGYRDLWTTALELPVLDLKTTAGGLTPVRVVGQAQSLGLAMRGADGKAYTFRSLHKHPERMLPAMWRERWPAKIAQDQTSGTHPGAALVQAALAKAAGVPFTSPRIVIMPDDPALGEFRKQFANEIGTIDEFPLAGPDKTPGYMGATEIVSSEEMWNRLMQGPENRVDSRALLRARVLDLWTDNYDRHRGQWRWMRIPGTPLWRPLPEDPDFVLVRHDGIVGSVIRGRVPDYLNFSEKFPGKLEGPLNNSYQVDRWLLTDLDAAAWEQVVKEVVGRLSDDVIDTALQTLPPKWYEISGRKTADELKKRRAGLEQYMMDVYRLEARAVNVHATDRDEVVTIARGTDNSVELTTAVAGAEPYYRRRFLAAETQEVRVHLHGGNDRVERTGEPGGPVTIRVVAGGGNDVIDDSKSGGTDVWKDAGTVEVQRGRGTNVRGGVWVNPEPVKGAPWIEPRSFGHLSAATPIVGFSPDAGFLLGYGVTRTGWGFRTKNAAASEQTLRGAFATSDVSGRLDYSGTFRRPASSVAFRFEALASGIERANFFGFGNDTPNEKDKSRYRTQQNLFHAAPALVVEQGRRFELFVAPEVRFSQSDAAGDSILGGSGAIGTGDYGQFAVRGGLRFDSRERGEIHAAADLAAGAGQLGGEGPHVTGVSLQASGFFVPKAWDVDSQYSGVDGTLAAYLGNTRAHLALRVGGRKLYGDYAWFDGAYIGSRNNRGFLSHRFTGDSSLFGTVALRAWIREVPVSVPVRFGVIAFADTGRVWYGGEDSNTWHNSFGGGLMFQPLATPTTVYAALAHSNEGNRFYFGVGFPF